ncbi:MAG: hypothetical protein SXG53_00690 [Pseudomonadota bacterium]|nr:hypothetical protein [Pseudomonadota bacterium]
MGIRWTDEQRVIIAGAGPIGAVLAYALRRCHIPVLLIEALPAPEIERFLKIDTRFDFFGLRPELSNPGLAGANIEAATVQRTEPDVS